MTWTTVAPTILSKSPQWEPKLCSCFCHIHHETPQIVQMRGKGGKTPLTLPKTWSPVKWLCTCTENEKDSQTLRIEAINSSQLWVCHSEIRVFGYISSSAILPGEKLNVTMIRTVVLLCHTPIVNKNCSTQMTHGQNTCHCESRTHNFNSLYPSLYLKIHIQADKRS